MPTESTEDNRKSGVGLWPTAFTSTGSRQLANPWEGFARTSTGSPKPHGCAAFRLPPQTTFSSGICLQV